MFVEEFGDEGKRFLDRLGIVRIQETCARGAVGGSRLGHVRSDARRVLRHAAHRQVVALPKRRKPEGRSRSGDRGGLPHAATKGFARSYRINLRLLPELAFGSGHDGRNQNRDAEDRPRETRPANKGSASIAAAIAATTTRKHVIPIFRLISPHMSSPSSQSCRTTRSCAFQN